MDHLNDYAFGDLNAQIFSKLETFTKSYIDDALAKLRIQLDDYPQDGPAIPISIGENCGPGVKIREMGLTPLGSMFFDNLVCPVPSVIELFRNDFRDLLQLKNLRISQWETHDSVFDDAYGIFYHHYFHLRPMRLEKSHINADGTRRRRIDEADIPLFLPLVASQFNYLSEKMRLVIRAKAPKQFLLRKVCGETICDDMVSLLVRTLKSSGARNFQLKVVFSQGLPDHLVARKELYHIPEQGVRWGDTDQWQLMCEHALPTTIVSNLS